MRQTLARSTILAVALVVTGRAQQKELPSPEPRRPGFSGTWNIDQAATDAASPPVARGGGRVTGVTGFPMAIRQTADSIAIERRGGDGATITTTYKLDGIERDVKTSESTVKAKAKWDGDKIIIETFRAAIPTTLIYAIDKDGVLWIETRTPQGTTRRAYKKSRGL